MKEMIEMLTVSKDEEGNLEPRDGRVVRQFGVHQKQMDLNYQILLNLEPPQFIDPLTKPLPQPKIQQIVKK